MEPQRPDATTANAVFDEAWRDHAGYLTALATRILRDGAEAEDMVQEAFTRLSLVDLDQIDDARGWLAVVVRRLSLDRLKSAHARRETSGGDALVEGSRPLHGSELGADPLDRITLDDQVQMALTMVLERLSPAERTSLLLHDVFGFPFPVVARIVGRSPEACRKLASRARRSVRSAAPVTAADAGVPAPSIDPRQVLAERFIAACERGDIAGLVEVLDPEAVGDASLVDGSPLDHVEGAEEMAERAMRYLGPESGATLTPVPLDDAAGLVATRDGVVFAVIRLDAAEGVVKHMTSIVRLPG